MTQHFPVPDVPPWEKSGLGWDANADGEVDEYESKVPEPLVLRGVLLALIGLVAGATGYALDVTWVEEAVAAYAGVAPLALSFWARRHVSPVQK